MITVKIEYRTSVPYDVIAVGYFHIDFYGDKANQYKREWYEISNKIDHKNDAKIQELESEIEKLKAIKIKWWQIIKSYNRDDNIYQLEEKIQDLKCNSCDNASNKHWESERFLQGCGFIMKSCVPSGKYCNDKIEMWEKTE